MGKNAVFAAVAMLVFLMLSSCTVYEVPPGTYSNAGAVNTYQSSYTESYTPYTLRVVDNIWVFYAGEKEAAVWEYRPDGTCIMRGAVINGPVRMYYGPNNVAAEIMFRNNVRDGYYRTYWSNGKIRESGMFSAGRREGSWMTYYKDGALYRNSMYHSGEQKNIIYEAKRPLNPGRNEWDWKFVNSADRARKFTTQPFDANRIYPKNAKKAKWYGENAGQGNDNGKNRGQWNGNNDSNGRGGNYNGSEGMQNGQENNNGAMAGKGTELTGSVNNAVGTSRTAINAAIGKNIKVKGTKSGNLKNKKKNAGGAAGNTAEAYAGNTNNAHAQNAGKGGKTGAGAEPAGNSGNAKVQDEGAGSGDNGGTTGAGADNSYKGRAKGGTTDTGAGGMQNAGNNGVGDNGPGGDNTKPEDSGNQIKQ